MAADMYIHIRTSDITDDVIKDFFACHLGSKHFNPSRQPRKITEKELTAIDPTFARMIYTNEDGSRKKNPWVQDYAYVVISRTPQIHVGEVSWLKAALFDDDATYVPPPVMKIAEIFNDSDGVTITDDVIRGVTEAFGLANPTPYQVDNPNPILTFLQTHKGERAFTVSW